MYHRILLPTDGSGITANAIETAIKLAKSQPGARLFAISVSEPFPYATMAEIQPVPPDAFLQAQTQMAQARVADVAIAAQAAGVPCETHTVEAMHPWEAILDHAKAKQCDVIVMASHGRRGLSALLLGSETQRVLIHSPLPVLVVKST